MMLGDKGFAERQGEVHSLTSQWHQQWQLA